MNQAPPIRRAVRVLPGRALHALTEFFRLEAAGGIVLILAALLALLFANSPLHALYESFRELPVALLVGQWRIEHSLLHWINDGLMAVFFLLVALEIKREALSGQLSSVQQMLLPLLCALAGVAVPAAIYAWINRGDAIALRGWAVPAATDIAFALGILSLLGKRVPTSMKLLLSTIAVVDDLVAIGIIAVFFSAGLSLAMLAWAGAAIALMALLNRRGVTALGPYLLLGIVLWLCVLKSGMHATLAGVVTGLMIPHRGAGDAAGDGNDASLSSPLERLEHALHPWVAYAILPLFAFANAGLALGGFGIADLLAPVPLGVALGLLLGKPLGVVGMALLARATGIVRLPPEMGVRALLGLGMLCGIGFTMSLFIASLAFTGTGELVDASVLGALCASLLAAVAGYLWLRLVLPAAAVRD